MLACKCLGIECGVYDMGLKYDPASGLLDPQAGERGVSVFDYAKFTQDIQKPGVVLLDELFRAPIGCFLPLELNYLPVANETYLLAERCGISKEKASNIAHVAAQLVADGWTAMEAIEKILLPMFERRGTEGERGVVTKIFMTRS